MALEPSDSLEHSVTKSPLSIETMMCANYNLERWVQISIKNKVLFLKCFDRMKSSVGKPTFLLFSFGSDRMGENLGISNWVKLSLEMLHGSITFGLEFLDFKEVDNSSLIRGAAGVFPGVPLAVGFLGNLVLPLLNVVLQNTDSRNFHK